MDNDKTKKKRKDFSTLSLFLNNIRANVFIQTKNKTKILIM